MAARAALLQRLFADPITSAHYIATPKEQKRPDVQSNLAALRAVVPNLQVLTAADVASAGVSYPVSHTVRYNVLKHEKHSRMDVATIGELGCADSHIRAWRTAAADPNLDGWTVVFEADAVPVPGILETVQRTDAPITSADPVGFALLGHGMNKPFGRDGGVPIPGHTAWVGVNAMWNGAHAYAIRNRDAETYLNALLPLCAVLDFGLWAAIALGDVPPVWTLVRSAFIQPELSWDVFGMHGVHLKCYLPADNGTVFAVAIMPWIIVLVMCIALGVVGGMLVRAKRPPGNGPVGAARQLR